MSTALPAAPRPEQPPLPEPVVASQSAKRFDAAAADKSGSGSPPPSLDDYQADRALHSMLARFSGGLSPIALWLAFTDWATHLATSPQRQIEIVQDAAREGGKFLGTMLRRPPEWVPWSLIKPQSQDRRFDGTEWESEPFNLLAQAFLLNERWWHNATTGVRGVAKPNEKVVEFSVRQVLDMMAPSNFVLTNPEVLQKTLQSGGANFMLGWQNWCRVMSLLAPGGHIGDTREFVVGKTVATARGKVVSRNELIELIQYCPTTGKVHPEPIVIVPAWIMKYYILDLSPHNSLVKFLTDAGFTVFMISWRNPEPRDRGIAFDDYRTFGVQSALTAIKQIVPGHRVHGLGYCLGGTLLSIAAATMARDGDKTLKSITLLAAQADFTEAGELTLFINESQVALLEDMMWEHGVLETTQMAGAFQLLRSNDLIWSQVTRDYLMGERAPPSDLMAWNADATCLPYRMHSEYLRTLFLNNDLAEGRYLVEGRPISLSDIHTPMFVVGTVRDHVAPWKSTYKIHFLTEAEVTFVLTSGGHNAGIVAPPGEPGHHYQVQCKPADAPYIGPDEWVKAARRVEGSWWLEWAAWLGGRSGELSVPPSMGSGAAGDAALPDAPGTYVLK
jgi:polyhydroxyalkanoate synthase